MNPENLKAKLADYITQKLPKAGIIALGSGSTVNHVIHNIAEMNCNNRFLSASSTTSILLEELGLEEIKLGLALKQKINLCIDGADLIFKNDPEIIVKGHGGALLQEKLIWSISPKIFVVADETKLTQSVTKTIPIEIIPRAYQILKEKLIDIEIIKKVELQMSKGIPFITDNGNYILHLTVPKNSDLRLLHYQTKHLTGVVETGVFTKELTKNTKIFIGKQSGVEVLS